MTLKALGLIETIGLPAAIEAADAAAKSANVQLLGYENSRGGGRITVKFTGDVGAVKAAVAAGSAAAARVGRVESTLVIPRPHADIEKLVLQIDRGTIGRPTPPAPSTPPPAPSAPTDAAPAPAPSAAAEPIEVPAAAAPAAAEPASEPAAAEPAPEPTPEPAAAEPAPEPAPARARSGGAKKSKSITRAAKPVTPAESSEVQPQLDVFEQGQPDEQGPSEERDSLS